MSIECPSLSIEFYEVYILSTCNGNVEWAMGIND
jgi:hypothetical protein